MSSLRKIFSLGNSVKHPDFRHVHRTHANLPSYHSDMTGMAMCMLTFLLYA